MRCNGLSNIEQLNYIVIENKVVINLASYVQYIQTQRK